MWIKHLNSLIEGLTEFPQTFAPRFRKALKDRFDWHPLLVTVKETLGLSGLLLDFIAIIVLR